MGEPLPDPQGEDHSTGPWQRKELLAKEALHIQMTTSVECFNRDGRLESPLLQGCCDEEAGRKEQFSPTFDLH